MDQPAGYDGNGNLTRRTTLVNRAPAGTYIQYTWDQRNQLTKIEFYNFPVNGTATLAKTVAYTYDVNVARVSDAGLSPGGNRISKTLTGPVSQQSWKTTCMTAINLSP